MTICETVAAGLLGIVGPILGTRDRRVVRGASTPTRSARCSWSAFAITVGTFVFILTQLSGQRWGAGGTGRAVFRDLGEVLSEGRYLKRWLVIAAIGQLPVGMVFAFSSVYAHEVKGADAVVLGGMAAAAAVGSIVLAIPLGRLADRVGRKRVLYADDPALLALLPRARSGPRGRSPCCSPERSSRSTTSAARSRAAMERELVPAAHMGRWIGIARVVKMLVSAALVLVAGAIWDRLGPEYVFLAFVAIDLGIRLPLLVTMPETLGIRFAPRPVPLAD